MMKQIFSGTLVSYQSQLNVDDQIKEGIPATFSLCVGAAIIWMGFGVLFGYLSAVHAGRFTDRALTILALVGISLPVFWLAAILIVYLSQKIPIFPNGDYVPIQRGPLGVVRPSGPSLDHPCSALRRLLQPGPALQHARRDERGLRAGRPAPRG